MPDRNMLSCFALPEPGMVIPGNIQRAKELDIHLPHAVIIGPVAAEVALVFMIY